MNELASPAAMSRVPSTVRAPGGGPGFVIDLGGELPRRGLLFSPPSCFLLRAAHERSRLGRCQCVREPGPHRIGTVLVNKWAISVSDKRALIQDWRSENPSRIGRVARKTRRGTGRPAAHAPRAAVSPTQRSTARAGPGPPAGRCEVSGRSASGANRWRLWCDRWPEPCRPQSGLPPTTPPPDFPPASGPASRRSRRDRSAAGTPARPPGPARPRPARRSPGCGPLTGLTCTTSGSNTDERWSGIDPLTATDPEPGTAAATSRSSRG